MVTGFRLSGWIAWTGRGFSTSSPISRPQTASRKPLLAGRGARKTPEFSVFPGHAGAGSWKKLNPIWTKSLLTARYKNTNHLAEPIEPLGDFYDRDGREGKRRGVSCRSQSGLPR